ncbi:phosphatidylinositol-3-phosphatase SAC1 [Sugiyamaella lignohabitans]|uniref:Phosphatidylinositol-3-phosphatase SAC1 n=1 Tax=Sugiyamaella lignohabitans TaxID=796027 RepID=A0A167EFE7_9ASCO|nr:phosphatidylinositol-3-phosphatase SAC1 [Sugiyamaella lignohabitans]ANB14011.1 phosphatidylinositol-3-phosphatase SAC1 [Sugiyamaella lignohabitans]
MEKIVVGGKEGGDKPETESGGVVDSSATPAGELEFYSYGLVGKVDYGPGFVFAITKREHVATVHGRDIYRIKKVVAIPLSYHEAKRKIIASKQAGKKPGYCHEVEGDGKGQGGEDGHETEEQAETEEEEADLDGGDQVDDMDESDLLSLVNDDRSDDPSQKLTRRESISVLADDVAGETEVVKVTAKKGKGPKWKRWFSKSSSQENKGSETPQNDKSDSDIAQTGKKDKGRRKSSHGKAGDDAGDSDIQVNQAKSETEVGKNDKMDRSRRRSSHGKTGEVIEDKSEETAMQTKQPKSGLMGKFVRYVRMSLSSGSFYFSYDLDLTSTLGVEPGESPFKNIRDVFFFNRHATTIFQGTDLLLPVIQGFIGHCSIPLQPVSEDHIKENIQSQKEDNTETTADGETSGSTGDMFLISRRSNKRAGVRFLRRGIDDDANCANWVETEQLVQIPQGTQTTVCSFTQVRGSMPLYFSQSPYKLQPKPKLLKKKDEMRPVFIKHFERLQRHYGEVAGISLVEKAPSRESGVGELYKQLADETGVYLEWFDFHRVCKGLRFDNVETLFDTDIGTKLSQFGWSDSSNHKTQKGVFRVNCIDCLDRTNVVETFIGKRVIKQIIAEHGLEFEDWKRFQKQFNNVWADNGDAISQQYSSTNALKGDFTRTSKRNYRGVLNDAFLTMSRYFYGMVSDFFMQATIDYVLGNVDEQVFDEFEENMESRDLLVNLNSVRSSAIEATISIVVASELEVLYGGWWLLTPRQGDIRRAELKDTVVLVTDSAVYICDFDLKAEKVVDYHRIPANSVETIQKGSFYGEILSQASKNPSRNRGFLIKYRLDGVTSASDDSSISASTQTPTTKPPSDGTPAPTPTQSVAIKIPATQPDDFIHLLTALQQCCKHAQLIDQDIVSLKEATSNTGLWDTLEYYMKRAVWA